MYRAERNVSAEDDRNHSGEREYQVCLHLCDTDFPSVRRALHLEDKDANGSWNVVTAHLIYVANSHKQVHRRQRRRLRSTSRDIHCLQQTFS